jgi:hypothetical protein
MTTLHDLQRALFPHARPVGTRRIRAEAGARDVGWVRVLKARVPAFEALDSADLAIIPGPALAVVAPGPTQIDELAVALARARVPAVLLVGGDTGRDALRDLGSAVTDAGLTALDLGRADPVALERRVIGFLVNRRAELDRRAADLEAELARLALAGHGLDVQAAAIGAFLGRAVVIEGRRGDALAVHAPAEDAAAAAAVARHLARPGSGVALRVDIAAAPGDPGTGGRLLLLGDEPDELDRIAADRVAPLLALELARDAAVRHAREETRRGDPLPTDGPPWVVLLATQTAADGPSGGPSDGPRGGPSDGPSDGPTGAAGDLQVRERIRTELALLEPARRLTLRGSSESLEIRLVAAAPSDDPSGLAIADRVARFLGRTVAVSRPFAEPGARAAAEAAARATLEAAGSQVDRPGVVRASRLPAYRMLGNLHNLPDGLGQARALLAPILVGSPERQRDRLETLGAVVGSPSLGVAAGRVGVHRNTIAYRVARLEELGDWDLADPDLRLALALAVKLVLNAQPIGEEPGLNRNRPA